MDNIKSHCECIFFTVQIERFEIDFRRHQLVQLLRQAPCDPMHHASESSLIKVSSHILFRGTFSKNWISNLKIWSFSLPPTYKTYGVLAKLDQVANPWAVFILRMLKRRNSGQFSESLKVEKEIKIWLWGSGSSCQIVCDQGKPALKYGQLINGRVT